MYCSKCLENVYEYLTFLKEHMEDGTIEFTGEDYICFDCLYKMFEEKFIDNVKQGKIILKGE